jgi:hypothetical protein
MTPKEILDKVSQIADTRFDETIGRLMVTLRQRHCKLKWRGDNDCTCEMCVLIKGEYVNAKLNLHRVRRRIDRLDLWDSEVWVDTLHERVRQMAEVTEKKKQLIAQQTL